MRLYETVFVVKPDIAGEDLEKIYRNVIEYLEKNNCQILKEENWGKRKLAYEINKYKEGQYYYIKYSSSNYDLPKELERSFNLNENILRYISVKLDSKKAVKSDKHEGAAATTNSSTAEKKEISSKVTEETKAELER
jgi:small subunit ribosomal protein S6